MAFSLPTFNLPVRGWHFGNVVTNPDNWNAVCNLSIGSRILLAAQSITFDGAPANLAVLLLPPLTDIRGLDNYNPGDVIECPAGSGRFYVVSWVEDFGKGFPNEHRFALILQGHQEILDALGNPWAAPPWPYPTP